MEELCTSDEEVLFVASLLCEEEDEEDRTKTRKLWIHSINQKRPFLGEFHHLFPDLEEDPRKFFQYFRISRLKFYELLDIIRSDILYKNTKFHKAVSPEERLAVCLR